MDGVISFLLFAGFFYLMMRFGCGSHMAHGHHKNATTDKTESNVDPVCNKIVELDKGYGKLHEGTLYRFCSKSCLDEFDQNPDKYLTQTSDKGA
ncbi:YHS domain-containing protein [Pseudoalteromonas sp. NZS127]|jgi:YHS domain-containing protein|uniref:YHS domain-containing protein n=1 Tax=Pseudoalteromonas TaxID=53246 RepID=UPI000C97A534|nr:YHS domain-containing protein [Pseudoalteromonas sp. NZS127]MAD77076.1 metal ion permease [Rheinheimera sp.]MBH0072630.1 YHS domain-containing protein [Pseudoalteromonas sp. NZS127]|tara:strand:- start:8293 stop:8574 length:282 start_codon:yes stop_codon:yes gene_type:complete